MKDIDQMNDRDMLGTLHDSVSKVPLSVRPPLEAIVARGRARQRRRRSGLAVAGVAAVVAFALGIPALTGTSRPPAPSAWIVSPVELGSGPVHVVLAAFSVNTNPDHTVTVTLTPGQVMDPNTFRQIMAQAGIPALIKVGSLCTTPDVPPIGPDGGAIQIRPLPDGTLQFVITPSKVPAGTEYSFGYFPDQVSVGRVTIGEPLTCTSTSDSQSQQPSSGTGSIPAAPSEKSSSVSIGQ